MATNSPPTRLDGELYEDARAVAPVMSRSTSQQIAHWARIGRELEASGSVSPAAVTEVLAGRRSYDGLGAYDQAAVRAEWAELMKARRESLDLASRFEAEGRPYATLDDGGEVVVHHDGPTEDRSGAAGERA